MKKLTNEQTITPARPLTFPYTRTCGRQAARQGLTPLIPPYACVGVSEGFPRTTLVSLHIFHRETEKSL